MYNKLYPTLFYWKYDIPNFEELKEYADSKNEVNNHREAWQNECKVDTTYIITPEFVDYIKPSLDLFLDEAFHGGISINAHYPWINYYQEGYFQEIHDHKTDIASVFFLNDGENFSQFYFYNRYNNIASNALMTALNYEELNRGDKWMPEYKAGQVLFFPGTMLHGVSVHKSKVLRKTLSCNFNIA